MEDILGIFDVHATHEEASSQGLGQVQQQGQQDDDPFAAFFATAAPAPASDPFQAEAAVPQRQSAQQAEADEDPFAAFADMGFDDRSQQQQQQEEQEDPFADAFGPSTAQDSVQATAAPAVEDNIAHASPVAVVPPALPPKKARPALPPKKADPAFFDPRAWVIRQLPLHRQEFTDTRPVRVLTGTWNVNAKKAKSERGDLSAWLCRNADRPGVCVLGFQEIVDLNAASLVQDSQAAAEPWEDRIQATLGPDYEQIASRTLVGLSLCVFVRTDLLSAVSDVRTDTVGVGVMGVGGNKGAVAISFNLWASPLLFVNVHMAAHKKNVKGRNSDFHNICKRLRLVPAELESGAAMQTAATRLTKKLASAARFMRNKAAERTKGRIGASSVGSFSKPTHAMPGHTPSPDAQAALSFGDFELVWWIGDLNYRLNLDDIDIADEHVARGRLPELLKHDQLRAERGAGRAFADFTEGDITFAPTYKYQPGTSVFERREGKKHRMPAWCDRVQWLPHAAVDQHEYASMPELTCSDHKPVRALFTVRAEEVVHARRAKAKQKLAALARQGWAACKPSITVSSTQLEFPDVRFDTAMTRTLRVTNTGKAVVRFRAVLSHTERQNQREDGGDEDDEENTSKVNTWLHVSPSDGTVRPGESAKVLVTVHVTKAEAHEFNTGQRPLRGYVSLGFGPHAKRQNVIVQGSYLQSFLGTPLRCLLRLNAPIRTLPPASLKACTDTNDSKPLPVRIPRELLELVQYLSWSAGQERPPLPLVYGADPVGDEALANVVNALDTGKLLAELRSDRLPSAAVAQCLLQWLRALPEPVLCAPGEAEPRDPPPFEKASACTTCKVEIGIRHVAERSRHHCRACGHSYCRDHCNWFVPLPQLGLHDAVRVCDACYAKTAEKPFSAGEFVVGMDLTAWCLDAMLEMGNEEYEVFLYIVTFLRELLARAPGQSDERKQANVSLLAEQFGGALTQASARGAFSELMPLSPAQIMTHLLTSSDFVRK